MIEYADLECPYCAKAHLILKELPITRVFRHFPVTSKHPRARVLAAAAEAAGLQGRFWEMHDSLLEDQGHLDDPHLWDGPGESASTWTASKRTGAPPKSRSGSTRDFRSGIRAGVATTPTQFVDGQAHPGVPDASLVVALRSSP